VKKYIEDIDHGKRPILTKERPGREAAMIEAIYLGLRQTDGIDVAEFNRRFGGCFQRLFDRMLPHLEASGHITTTPDRCALTRKGMQFLDSIASMFVEAL
jgi:oxygen-independent coproporphyrinogen-3 oxidase